MKRRRKRQKCNKKKSLKKSLSWIWISLSLTLTQSLTTLLELYTWTPTTHSHPYYSAPYEVSWAGSLATSPVRWAVVSSFYFRCHAIAKNSMSPTHQNSSSHPSFFLLLYCTTQGCQPGRMRCDGVLLACSQWVQSFDWSLGFLFFHSPLTPLGSCLLECSSTK